MPPYRALIFIMLPYWAMIWTEYSLFKKNKNKNSAIATTSHTTQEAQQGHYLDYRSNPHDGMAREKEKKNAQKI